MLRLLQTQTLCHRNFQLQHSIRQPVRDQGAHSMKFTLSSVLMRFSIILVAVEVDGDGVCESGMPGDPTDPIDCRFVRYFGEPPFNGSFQSTNVPQCYAYSSTSNSAPFHCVYYSVQDAPPTSYYTGPVLESIAWNTLETETMPLPANYVNSPRMYDDPSDDLNIVQCAIQQLWGDPIPRSPTQLNNSSYQRGGQPVRLRHHNLLQPESGNRGNGPHHWGQNENIQRFRHSLPIDHRAGTTASQFRRIECVQCETRCRTD